MHVIVTCKYEKEQMKNSREKVKTPFFHITTLSVTMETSGCIWPNFKLIQALMYVIITCKYKKDPIKNSREKVEKKYQSLRQLPLLKLANSQYFPLAPFASFKGSLMRL